MDSAVQIWVLFFYKAIMQLLQVLHFVDNIVRLRNHEVLCLFKRDSAKVLEKLLASKQGRVKLLSGRRSIQ